MLQDTADQVVAHQATVIQVEVPLPQIFSILAEVIEAQEFEVHQTKVVFRVRPLRTALIEDQDAVSFALVAQVSFTIATTLSELSRSVVTVTQL
jgi:hypothetical protein